MYWMHKGFKNKNVKNLTEEEINEMILHGWAEGKCPSHWVTNGIDNKLLKVGNPMPDGYWYGQSDDFKLKNSLGNKKRWKNMSEEDRRELSSKISNSVSILWSNLSQDERYNREYNRMTSRNNWTEEQRQTYCENMSKSAKENRKNVSKDEYHRRNVKATATRKKNNSFNTSSFEERCYGELCESFGRDDIIREYVDSTRYPFKCDFYIKSKDLFIELNLHPSHGTHRFNSSDNNDLLLKSQLELNGDRWSKMILNVWCVRDVEKYSVAENNHINYMCVYGCDFDNFIKNIRGGNL